MPRLVLINPVPDQTRGWHRREITRFPPLGLTYLAAVTPEHWEVELLDENVGVSPYSDADLVGMTSFTSTVNRAYEIASFYRRKQIPVIMGGIHATMMPDEALHHVDSVVQGEGEWIWKEVLQHVENGELRRIYTSIPGELSSLPPPKRMLFDSSYSWGTIQTSRGCPMDCHFCSVTAFNGRRFRQRPLDDVLEELEMIPQKNIFFVDDNLLGYGREAEDRAIRLFRGMAERKMRKRFVCQTSLNFANNSEVLKWAQKAGCKMIFIGFESISERSLKDYGKNFNLKTGVDQYKKKIRKCHTYGIGIIGAFILGSDGDDSGIFQRTLRFVQESGLDVIQGTFSTPLPGTKLFQKLHDESRITHTNFPKDWRKFRFSHVVFKPHGMSPEDLYSGMTFLKDNIYRPMVFAKRILRTFLETRDFTTALFSYKANKAYRKAYMESAYFQPYSSSRNTRRQKS